ncbi:MAG: helix-turn-helix domain-containing protein [Methanomicrobiales archaeon]|nr:helix-turn-helix domain-containing protein [Methanomicrobiales archaeon]
MTETEGVILLDPGDEKAQRIGRAIASPLAGEILQKFAAGPRTLSKISEDLQVPINTAKYHVENLLEAGLLEVVDTKYSEKGREMKLYALRNQVVIVAPKRADVRALLTRYASIFGIVVLATAILAILQPLLVMPGERDVLLEKGGEFIVSATQAPPFAPTLYTMETVLAFFIGALLVLLLVLVLEARRRGCREG